MMRGRKLQDESMGKKTNWLFLLLGIALGLGGLGAGMGAAWLNSPPSSGGEEKMFTVHPGASVTSIAEELESLGVIRSRYLLRLLAMIQGETGSYQVGSYRIPGGLTTMEVQEFLTSGKQLLVRVTIPEGLTSRKIAQLLEKEGITSAKGFLEAVKSPRLLEKYQVPADSLDGLLFPDTYLFPHDFPSESAVDHMVTNFMKNLKNQVGGGADISGGAGWYNRVILASIVEREYRVEEEAPLIASVFENRIQNRIPLGSCASIEYIITEIKNRPHPKRIFFVDTEIPSPYNTYINVGLPPGPISNPGLTALKASFNPAKTDYLYFVVKDASRGTHVFSTNYRDHNEARESYLSGFQSKD